MRCDSLLFLVRKSCLVNGIFSGGTLNSLLKYWSSASFGYDIDTELIWIKITALGFLDDLHSSG